MRSEKGDGPKGQKAPPDPRCCPFTARALTVNKRFDPFLDPFRPLSGKCLCFLTCLLMGDPFSQDATLQCEWKGRIGSTPFATGLYQFAAQDMLG